MHTDTSQRIADLRRKLAARMQDGKPKLGYQRNVLALKAEIARLHLKEARNG